MSVSYKVNYTGKLSATLRGVVRRLSSNEKQQMLESAGKQVQVLTEAYLLRLAATRHKTATKLGATPSDHLKIAAEKVSRGEALEANSNEAVLTIDHPGMSRAFGDVRISPKAGNSLTIPVHAIAYNRRAKSLWNTLNLFIPKGKKNKRYIAMKEGNKIVPIYLLVRSLTQKQDRSLLPGDNLLAEAAALGARNYISDYIKSNGLI